jgi:hypothetical protein
VCLPSFSQYQKPPAIPTLWPGPWLATQVLHKDFPDLKNVPVGKTNAHDEYTKDMDFVDGSKAEKVLGIKYKSFEQTVVEMCKSVRERFGFWFVCVRIRVL